MVCCSCGDVCCRGGGTKLLECSYSGDAWGMGGGEKYCGVS
jgi:hypothetical protein